MKRETDLELAKRKYREALELPMSDPNRVELISIWRFNFQAEVVAETGNKRKRAKDKTP